MAERRGLGTSLSRAFLIQAALIALVAAVGVYAAAYALEEVLIRQALEEESEHYWERRGRSPDFQLPDTRNLTGYLNGPHRQGNVPPQLAGLPPGFHQIPSGDGFSAAHVSVGPAGSSGTGSPANQETLYLTFDGDRVHELAVYFGLAPLAGALMVLYIAAWIAYRLARRAISPVVQLANAVARLDPESPDPEVFAPDRLPPKADHEVHSLAASLRHLIERVNAFVERERNFTRDASHELRSPLTVIGLAADMLLSEQDLDRPARNSVLRIKRSTTDMQELTEALLLLARESDCGISLDEVCVNDVVREEYERARALVDGKPVAVEFHDHRRLLVRASEKVLSVLIGNLLRNAFIYTDQGQVDIVVNESEVLIRDSGIGIPSRTLSEVFKPFVRGSRYGRRGHGVGLSIVKRLADRFGWLVQIESTEGVGTQVTVCFADSVVVPKS